MTGQRTPFLLFRSLAINGTHSVQEVADGREEWHGAIALNCEICRGITASGRYYHDALGNFPNGRCPSRSQARTFPFLDTVSLQFQGHQLYETRRYFQSGIRAEKARYKA